MPNQIPVAATPPLPCLAESSLGPLSAPTGFVQMRSALGGGMTYRSDRVTFPNRTLRVWTFEMPDGELEQYQGAPVG